MSKYFAICNLDHSTYTYGSVIDDQKVLKDLKYSFLDKKDFDTFVKPSQLIADVEVDESTIEHKKFPDIDSRILYAKAISLSNFRIHNPTQNDCVDLISFTEQDENKTLDSNVSKTDEKSSEKKQSTNTSIMSLDEQFNVILSTLNVHGELFGKIDCDKRSYPRFMPEKYLKDEVVLLQNKLSDCLRIKDESEISLASFRYNDKSLNFEQNINKTLLKMFRLIGSFNSTTNFLSKLELSPNNVLRSGSMSKNDEEYQSYLNMLSFFAGYLLDHPIIN